MTEGSLEVKLPTIWTDGKAEVGRVREEKRREEKRSEKGKSQNKENAGARKGRKVAIHCVFRKICGSGGSKSRLAKPAGAETSGQMRDEKLHAVVARSTFPSQHVQNTPGSDHFWKLRCRKSARRCGAKQISKSKVEKNLGVRTTFGRSDVVFSVVGTRDSAPCQKRTKHEGFVAVSTTTTTTTTALHSTTLQLRLQLQLNLHYATLHTSYTTLRYNTLHYTTLH